MNILNKRSWWIVLAAMAWLGGALSVTAQVDIGIKLKQDLYIQYGETQVIVAIRNLAGRDVYLDNEPDKPWLSFRLKHESGRVVQMNDPLFKFPPLLIRSGETLKRSVDLRRLFTFETLGQYTLFADLYLLGSESYVSSNRQVFNVSRGHQIWEQVVGVPDSEAGAGGRRRITLYTHRLVDRVYLYMKISNPDSWQIYCMRKIGRYASYAKEIAVDLDARNNIHCLHLAAPRTYLYTVTDLNGNLTNSTVYLDAEGSRPKLVNRSGKVRVSGGRVRTAADRIPGQEPIDVPKISERPVDFD